MSGFDKNHRPGETVELVRRTLSEQIYDCLKADILSQRIGFGEKLGNRELQKRFGVSSTPVRDAINRLYTDGLVAEITNGGARVIPFDLAFALEVNEVVAMLNTTAVDQCLRRADTQVLAGELERLLRLQKAERSPGEYFRLDCQFHGVFFAHCQNRQLEELYRRYAVLQEMLVRSFHDFHQNYAQAVTQHEEIVRALLADAPSLAVDRMRQHYQEAEGIFRMHLQ